MQSDTLLRSFLALSGLQGLKKLKAIFLEQSRVRGTWVLGLDQGTSALRYVLWDRKSGVMIRYGQCEFERQGAGGGKARLDSAGALREIARGIPKNKLCAVHMNIQGGVLQLGFLEMSASSKGIQPSVFYHALKPNIPFAVEEAAMVYREAQLQPATPGAEGRKAIVNYAACHKPVIAKMIKSVQSVFGLTPDVSTQGYAQETLLSFLGVKHANEYVAVISGGRSITSISIFKEGKLLFEREIPLAGQDITRSIFITHLQGQTLRSAEDLKIAEQLKCQSAIPMDVGREALEAGHPQLENQRIYQAIQGVLSAWIQDIRLSFSYFNENYEDEPIQNVYLVGGMANHQNLAGCLSRELSVPVRVLKWPEHLNKAVPPSQNENAFQNDLHEYATALGLALKPDLQSSLTPREYLAADWAQIWQALLRVFVFTASVFFIAAFFFLQSQESRLKSVKLEVDTHRQFLNKLEGPYQEMLRWESLLKRAEFPTVTAAKFFEALFRLAPSDLVLIGLSYDRASGDISMEGFIYGDARRRGVVLVEFSKVFKRDPRFKKVEVPVWESSSSGTDKGRFRLTAQYKSEKQGTL